jgi:hypothetical protein
VLITGGGPTTANAITGECFVNGGGIKNEKLRDPGSRPVLKADKRKRSIVFDYSKKSGDDRCEGHM